MKAGAMLKRVGYTLRSRRVRLVMAVDLLLLAAFLVVWLAYWWPSARAEQALQRQVEERRQALTLAMQANELAKAYAGATRAADVVERKLQASVKQAQLVQSLAMLARRHGVRIVSESYEEGKRQADYIPLLLQVALEGRYDGLRSFLGDISSLPLWVEVEEARVERLREPAGQLKAQLRLRVVRRVTTVATAPSS